MEPVETDIALSTCWASHNAQSAAEILDKIEATGFTRLELEYRLTTPILGDLLPELKPRGLRVSSVHNYCPLPPQYPRTMASGDLFDFATRDPEERQNVVRYTIKSVELASELEAKAVVLHLGKAPMPFDKQLMKDAAAKGGPDPAILALLPERAKVSATAMDAVSFCLDKIIPRAQKLGVVLGLENRYHVPQVPSLEELELLLQRFAGAPLAPWLDLGHAWVKANAGLRPVGEWLEHFAKRLIGCHLHDIKGSRDHQVPGQGEVDWHEIMAALSQVPIKVMEIHPGPSAQEIREGLEVLRTARAAAASRG